ITVITGKDKGREGIIEKIYFKNNTALVQGVNIYKKHIKKNEKMPQGGDVEVPRPLAVSKIMLLCPVCKKSTRVEYKVEKNKKRRMCKKCKSII
ncbi:50S ribosomal protein L24, partial [Candidatus Roizmanbacteria bacterium CG_4_10_14_0_8_um_filter_33_9]